MAKVVRGADVTFWKGGVVTESYREANEVCVRLRSAKADIFNAGQSSKHFRSGKKICAVAQRRRPERFEGGE